MCSSDLIDFGCGSCKVPGSIGVDLLPLEGVDIAHDLRRFPYPFPTNSADRVYMHHVLEHVEDVLPVMEEVHRILKPGGEFHIKTPHCSGLLAWTDPTHRRSFTAHSFDYYGGNGYSYYTTARFDIQMIRLQYQASPPRTLPRRAFGVLVQRICERHPWLAERIAAWVGGIDEIQVNLVATKATISPQ